MKKIVFVIGIMGNGGAERVIASLANKFCSLDVKVCVIAIYGERQDYCLDDRIEFCPIICRKKFKLLRPIERIKYIRKKILEFKPNCIVSFLADVNIHTILACGKLHIPLVVSERNDPQKDPINAGVRYLRNALYKKVDGIVFQTRDAEEYFLSYLSDKNLKTVIPNPIISNLPYYDKSSQKSNRLITACRLSPQKNLRLMIDAVSDLLEEGISCKLDIYGDGPEKENLLRYIDSKGLSKIIKLNGFSKDIHSEMSKSSAFIISSDYEGISNSMLEALAIGVPVIATDCPVGGARMFIENGENGYLVPVGDRFALKEAVKNILNDNEKAIIMGEKATNIRKILDVELIVRQWIDFLNKVEKSICCKE